MKSEKLSFHKVAALFLKTYYDNNNAENVYFTYGFLCRFAKEAKLIAKSLELKNMDYQNALVATWFRFAGTTDISDKGNDAFVKLLNDFFLETDYPENERSVVENAIYVSRENKYPDTEVQKVVCDAINSRLAWTDFQENMILFKEELNRLHQKNDSELFFLQYYKDLFLRERYYTAYAGQNYAAHRQKNFQMVEKRIAKLDEMEKAAAKRNALNDNLQLSNKETEEFFKLAFRNYNHLISVADSKAALLIRVNSIIISILLGLVLSKVEKNIFMLAPTVLLLLVSTTTITISILASKPRKNSFSEDKKSRSYQKFFFGSFDLIDPSFRHATWDGYYTQLHDLFASQKEQVFMEVYKESFNVRKVLSRKFSYLSLAYKVFIIGLATSIIIFIINMKAFV
jgi:hypothetical protein